MREKQKRAQLERRLTWVFGSPRTGTTWLLNLVCSHPHVLGIDEPGIGMHLALYAPGALGVPAAGFNFQQLRVNDSRAGDDDYFFAASYADVWRQSVRALLIDRLAAHVDRASARSGPVVIKEPNGSLGADIVMSLLPGSRLLWMIRDGRDVIDSQLDAAQKGSWLAHFGGGLEGGAAERLSFVEEQAHLWVARTRVVQRAYDAHAPARRHVIRYEEMRTDTLSTLQSLYGWLGVKEPADLPEIVARRSFEALPVESTGSGQFARAATPGLWRDNLTPAEQRVANGVMGETLAALGYEA
jgi:hypothetical protein